MGWKGTVRTINSELKKADKRRAAYEKQVHINNVTDAVADFEKYLSRIVSYHKFCSEQINWISIKEQKQPAIPQREQTLERNAKNKYKSISNNYFLKLTKLDKFLKRIFLAKIIKAKSQEKEYFASSMEKYQKDLSKWKLDTLLAEKVLAGDEEAYRSVILNSEFFSDVQMKDSITISVFDKSLRVEIGVLNHDVVPKTIYTQLKSGKLSEKDMPKTQWYTTYQDYVSSVTLRVAREMLAAFPIDEVVVSAHDDLLNSSTGRLEKQFILSIQAPRESINQLVFSRVDPSDALKNINHNVNFKVGIGFTPIQKINSRINTISA